MACWIAIRAGLVTVPGIQHGQERCRVQDQDRYRATRSSQLDPFWNRATKRSGERRHCQLIHVAADAASMGKQRERNLGRCPRD
jgi:hypothetical protein